MPDLSQRLNDALSDRYRIERELGRGGMATVYLAEDLKHHRRVAIKVLDPEVAAAVGSERFLHEIETVARLTHPHILPLYDSGAADGLLFYVMPFVEGESLRDRLMREKQLTVDEALRVTREVADALGYAHGHGLVHRDIKPENILLESGVAVLADFGIARIASSHLTQDVRDLGTPVYMSPEQVLGQPLDGRADLFSLGVLAYRFLTGSPPFRGSDAVSVAYQVADAPYLQEWDPVQRADMGGRRPFHGFGHGFPAGAQLARLGRAPGHQRRRNARTGQDAWQPLQPDGCRRAVPGA